MTKEYKIVRAIGGLIAIFGLVTLTVLDAIHPDVDLTTMQVFILVSLISGLLSADIMDHDKIERGLKALEVAAKAYNQGEMPDPDNMDDSQTESANNDNGESDESDDGSGEFVFGKTE